MRAASGAIIAILLLVSSCTFNYGEASLADDLERGLPDTSLVELRQLIVQGDRRRIELRAGLAEYYAEDGLQLLYDVSFEERNGDGELLSYGTAGEIQLTVETEDVELGGGVEFYSQSEETLITSERFTWDSDERILRAAQVESVRLERDDGTVIEGRGFEARLAESLFSFAAASRGSLVVEDAGSDEEAAAEAGTDD